MELKLIRKYFKDTYTIGNLYIDEEFFCNTLEDPVRDLKDINHDNDFDEPGEGKIYGETAIPYGRYKIIVSYSPKLKRRLPLLQEVEGFTGIRMHSVATAKDTEGCIGLGLNKIKGRLVNGPYFETRLVQMIDEASDNGIETFITIKA